MSEDALPEDEAMTDQDLGGPGTAVVAVTDKPAVARAVTGSVGLLRPIAPISDIIDAQNEARKFIHTALKEGRDYGVIPGTNEKKKSLWKPGAERVNAAYGVLARFEFSEQEVDHDRVVNYEKKEWDPDVRGKKNLVPGQSKGLYRYVIRCSLYKGDTLVGEGLGSCSSMETKYVDRPRDLENTIIKIAKKRAFVDATLTTFGLSDEFSQDYDEDAEDKAEEEREQRRLERQGRVKENVQAGVQKASDDLRRVQEQRASKRQLSKVDKERAGEIKDRVLAIWDQHDVVDAERMDDARVAMHDRDIPRMENGIPDIDQLGPSDMATILEYVRRRYETQKTPAAPATPLLVVRRVEKTLHILDPLKTKECIGCRELLSGQKAADLSKNAKDYCQPALVAVDKEYAPDRIPAEMQEALAGLAST